MAVPPFARTLRWLASPWLSARYLQPSPIRLFTPDHGFTVLPLDAGRADGPQARPRPPHHRLRSDDFGHGGHCPRGPRGSDAVALPPAALRGTVTPTRFGPSTQPQRPAGARAPEPLWWWSDRRSDLSGPLIARGLTPQPLGAPSASAFRPGTSGARGGERHRAQLCWPHQPFALPHHRPQGSSRWDGSSASALRWRRY